MTGVQTCALPIYLPLGVLVDEVFQERTVRLAGGDLLAVYSDGLTDAVDAAGNLFGEQPLIDALTTGQREGRSPGHIVQAVMDRWHRFRAPGLPADDTSLMVLRLPRDLGPDGRR